ncbi:hypothetical protein JCM8547_000454 [Rhodosporidiobolus lusitaniae]
MGIDPCPLPTHNNSGYDLHLDALRPFLSAAHSRSLSPAEQQLEDAIATLGDEQAPSSLEKVCNSMFGAAAVKLVDFLRYCEDELQKDPGAHVFSVGESWAEFNRVLNAAKHVFIDHNHRSDIRAVAVELGLVEGGEHQWLQRLQRRM